MYKTTRVYLLIVILLASMFVLALAPNRQETKTESAKFVLSGWTYPDDYGQGISSIYLHENSTGSWVAVLDPAFILPSDSSTIEIPNVTENTALRLQPSVRINHTLHDLNTIEEAYNIIRLDITVSCLGEVIFSKQNLTLEGAYGDATATTWWISYEVIIDVLIVAGEIYTATLGYEIYLQDDDDDDSTLAFTGSYYGTSSDGNYTETFTKDDSWFSAVNTSSGSVSIVYLDFSLETSFDTIDSLNISSYCESSDVGTVDVWNGTDWDNIGELPLFTNWVNFTISGSYAINGLLLVRWLSSDPSTPTLVKVDYASIDFHASSWVEVSEVNIYLHVPFDKWGLQGLIIILGMIMVPLSTMYLIVGAKHDRRMDRLFYGLVVFFIGWALLIGGIIG